MRRYVCGVMTLTGTLFGLPALAQDPTQLTPGIAHISAMKGKVLVRHGAGGNQVPATLNTPLASGDVITTEAGARADIALDSAHNFRLAGEGEVRLDQSEYEHYQIALGKGGIVYRVLGPSAAIAAVDTPSVSAAPTRAGVYRMSLSRGGESEVRADEGEILVYAATGSTWVNQGERLRARGPADNPEFRILRRSRTWRRLAQVLGNIQVAADIGSSGGSDSSSSSDSSPAKKSTSDNSGKSAGPRATPHPSHTPTEALKSDSAHGQSALSHTSHPAAEAPKSSAPAPAASHSGGSSHTSTSSSSNATGASHSDSSSHTSSTPASVNSSSSSAASSSSAKGK
jgi:hypothetical protein